MKICRFVIVLFFVTLQSIANGAPSLPSGKIQTVKGVFKSFNGEDYMYVNVEIAGKNEAYYCLDTKCADWEMKEREFQGQNVELRIRAKKFYFKEIKESREIIEVLDLKISKKP